MSTDESTANPDASCQLWEGEIGRETKEKLEARVGIEPTHKGFADLSLTTWVPRPELKVSSQARIVYGCIGIAPTAKRPRREGYETILERETGFEPATSTLARSHSTAELLPLSAFDYKRPILQGQTDPT
jgi:hypothetical protein